MTTGTWNDRDDYEASALEDRELAKIITSALPALDRELETCACDMRHPDDDSAFEHHPSCSVGRRKPAYTNNLPWIPGHLGLKTIKVTNEVVVTTQGTQLVCTTCEAPFTIDQWLMRIWDETGDLYHEGCAP